MRSGLFAMFFPCCAFRHKCTRTIDIFAKKLYCQSIRFLLIDISVLQTITMRDHVEGGRNSPGRRQWHALITSAIQLSRNLHADMKHVTVEYSAIASKNNRAGNIQFSIADGDCGLESTRAFRNASWSYILVLFSSRIVPEQNAPYE